MKIQYLLDENLPSLYQQQLKGYLPQLTVVMIGDTNVPPRGTLDPEILLWCEQNNFILVSKNRRSMPVHLAEHLGQNHQIPGIFVLRKKCTIRESINDLIFLAQAGQSEDYQNRITYIPL